METLTFELLVVIISGVGNFLLGLFTFIRKPRSATNRFFSLLTFVIALYLGINYLSLHTSSQAVTFVLVKSVMSLALLINLLFYYLSKSFPDDEISIKPAFLYTSLAVTLLLSVLAETSFVFSKITFTEKGITPTPGVGMFFFMIHTVFFLGLGVITLIKKFRTSEDRVRSQLKLLFIGTIIMFSLILLSNVLLVIVFNVSIFVGLLPVYTLMFTGFVSYSIVRYELFEVKVIAAQFFSLIISIVLFSKVFVSSGGQVLVDIFLFVVVTIFGVLLTKSVTREVSQRRELQELTERLRAMDKQKNEFISMAAHELRAPLTAIKGYISMILEGDTGDIPEKTRGFLADTNSINERLIRLVNNMLNVNKIEEGRMVYQTEEVFLSEVLRTAYAQFRQEAEREGLEFVLQIPKEIKDRVLVDPDRIHEVVANFLSNALKYTEEGSVKIKALQPDSDHIRVEIIDTGGGVSDEEQAKLFRKFYRAESEIGKTTGTGLGLYICKLLIEKFNGQIGLISKVGEGSTFWFSLPIVK